MFKLGLKQQAKQRVKTPTLLQMEEVECGAAALGIILGYYGRFVPLAELRQECGVSRDGSQPANIVKAARNYGLKAKAFKKETDKLAQMRLPAIAFWNFSHLLVVEGIDKDQVYLNDPATGPRTVSRQEFDETYIGVALAMEPGTDFKKGGCKPSILLSLLTRLKTSVGAVVLSVVLGFLLVIPGLAIPVFSQVFVDQILVEDRTDWLRPLLLGMLVTTLMQGFLFSQQRRFLRQLQIKLAASMSSSFFWHLLKLPVGFYTQRFPGEIGGRVKLNDKVAQAISGQMAETIINATITILYVLVMFAYNWLLAAIALLLAIVNIVVLVVTGGWLEDCYMQLDKDGGKIEGVAIAGIQSIETLKASALESDFFARWSGYFTKKANTYKNMAVMLEILYILPAFLTALTTTLVLIVGGWQVMAGQMTIGMLVAFQALLTSFQTPINQLMGFGAVLPTLAGNLMRLDDVLTNATDIQLENHSRKLQTSTPSFDIGTIRLSGRIELSNLTFGYAKVDRPLIENFNCVIQPGQRVALVGGSGSGKSTVAKLVAGLYEPWSGEILFDGKSRLEIPRAVLANSIATVEQEVFLFSGSVRDNLTLWDTTVSDSQIRRACIDARIQDVIMALPGGYNGELLEGGVNLSGGQRQRLEIARSLLHNPSILILDEATSALDGETEQLIYNNLRQRGCSCLIVAHRLSSIRDCDEIIVLDRGVVVQRGTHNQLMQMGGFYAELVHGEEAEDNEE
ncbi:NHLP family bacteriocin export ABC transporter peptidase/permease/ATPase subunit [Calothrix sp. NIES-2098]|uniref:NHLP family bacteriocin export ABC transporter peptidase/permease/ATPase subunit n=1 Tax=Calothrix sp. NIES-2098 TaxID=1954171 RepID=UPI000B606F7E|nr:ABC transporter-related protein [Calothrix sp. NIES-2098]